MASLWNCFVEVETWSFMNEEKEELRLRMLKDDYSSGLETRLKWNAQH